MFTRFSKQKEKKLNYISLLLLPDPVISACQSKFLELEVPVFVK